MKKWLWVALGVMIASSLISTAMKTDFTHPGAVIGFIMCIVYLLGFGYLIWYLNKTKDQRRAKKVASAQRRQEAKAERQKRQEKDAFYRRMRADEKTPIAARVVLPTTAEKVSRNLSIGVQMLVGGTLFGQAGAMLGAFAGARHKYYVEDQKVTFSVTYKNGHHGTETVKIGTARYNELCAVLIE